MLGLALPYIKVFFALFAMDWVWAKYMLAVNDRRAFVGGYYAALIIALTILSTSEWIKDPWLAIPAMLGAFAGTYISTSRAS